MSKSNEATLEVPAENTGKKAFDMEALKAEIKADLLKEMGGTAKTESAPVYISKPQTEAEAAEAARLAKQKKDEAESEAWLNEIVTVQLFKDGKEYKDDLYVSVNGKNVHIKRGILVPMKRKFAMQIEMSQIQAIKAAEFSEGQEDAYKQANSAGLI